MPGRREDDRGEQTGEDEVRDRSVLDYSVSDQNSLGRTRLPRFAFGLAGRAIGVAGLGMMGADVVFWWIGVQAHWYEDAFFICGGAGLLGLGIRCQLAVQD